MRPAGAATATLLLAASAMTAAICAAAGSRPDAAPAARVSFCRRVDAEDGRRIGVGDRFAVAKKREVVACIDLEGVAEGRIYGVHIVWLGPEGRELFRKHCELRPRRDGDAWSAAVVWKRADRLFWSEAETLRAGPLPLTLTSRIGVDPERDRSLGLYRVQAYVDRRLAAEASFSLLAVEPDDPKPAAGKPARKRSGGGGPGRRPAGATGADSLRAG